MAKGFDFIGMVVSAPEDQRSVMLAQMAEMSEGVTLESLEAELKARLEANKAKAEAEAKRLEREKRTAAIEALRAEVEGSSMDTLPGLFERVTAEGGQIVLSGFDGDSPRFTVAGIKTPAKGGTGGGKPGGNEPRPYVDAEGKRVTGPYNKWAVANVPNLAELAAENEVTLEYSEKGNLRGKGVESLLRKAGVIIPSEVTAAELAEYEATKSA